MKNKIAGILVLFTGWCAYGQSRLMSPVVVYPPGGGTSSAIWLKEALVNGNDEIKFRVPALPASYDFVYPSAPGNVGDCLKQLTTSTTVLALTVGSCDGSNWSRVGTVLSPLVVGDDVRYRRWVIEDFGGSGLTWDMYGDIGNPAATTNRVQIRDNANVPVVEYQRTFVGTVTNNAYLDMNWLPRTDGTRSLGGPSLRWAFGHINDVRANFIAPPAGVLELNGDLVVTSGNTVGLSSQRIPKIWAVDLDLSGTCTGPGCPGAGSPWTRNSTTGVVSLVTATDDTVVRKIRWDSNDGSGLSFDTYATVTGTSPGTRELVFADNAGAPMFRLQRQFAGAVVNEAIIDLSLIPATTNSRVIGKVGRVFSESHILSMYTQGLELGGGATNFSINGDVRINGSILPTPGASATAIIGNTTDPFEAMVTRNNYTLNIRPAGGTFINIFGDYIPSGTVRLGSVANRIDTIYAANIDCAGGTCPGSKWTDTGATTYLTATGDNVAIGLGSTIFKFEVAGTSKLDGDVRIGGNWYCVTDGGCDIGDGLSLDNRPAFLYLANGVFGQVPGSPAPNYSLTNGGLIIRHTTTGVTTAQISSTTGRISTILGFSVNGVNGYTGSNGAGCTITGISGGMITSAIC